MAERADRKRLRAVLKRMDRVGIARVMVSTVQDERVCPDCSAVEGKVFSVKDALKTMIEFKRYRAAVTFDDEAGVFHEEVMGTRDVIVFEGTSVAQLKKEFEFSTDDYLKVCIDAYVRYYDRDRLHSSLDYQTPDEVHKACKSRRLTAQETSRSEDSQRLWTGRTPARKWSR